MFNIIKLFGRSPFTPLQHHMEKVSQCVLKMAELFEILQEGRHEELEARAAEISKLEHAADVMKNDIRHHLPRGLFLPINRNDLLKILSLQDSLADKAEDIAILLTFKPLTIPDSFREDFNEFLEKNIAAFQKVRIVMNELDNLAEASFGGIEAEHVKAMINDVAFIEHEVDLIQRKLLKKLYSLEKEMSYSAFHLWQNVLSTLASISNLAETLAYRVHMTLELK